MFAGFHKLQNLVIIIDYNKLQSLTSTTKTLNLEPFKEKWVSFGWDTKEINGNNLNELKKNLVISKKKKPKCIIAHTTKGKGVSFMENKVLWHYRSPNKYEMDLAINEIENER
jgi:transketolase